MKGTNKLLAITIAVVGMVWGAGIFMLSRRPELSLSAEGTLTFGLIAIAASCIYLLCFHTSPGRQAVEEGSISLIVTVIYAVAAIALNTSFFFRLMGGFSGHLLMANIVLNAAYFLVLLYVEKNTQGLIERLDRTEKKAFASRNIAGKLGTCLSIAQDTEVRSRLLKLKEAVSYSSNITTAGTSDYEQQMDVCLDELIQLITAKGPAEDIQSKLQEIEICWKMRSSAASSER